MGCLAEMTVAHPTSGSFGAWAEFYISPLAGFLVRYAYWAGVVFALGTEVTAIAVYMRFWFPSVPGWIWIVGFTLALVLVNAFNVRLFGASRIRFLRAQDHRHLRLPHPRLVGRLLRIRTHARTSIGFRNYTAYGGFFPKGFSGMWVAVLVALFSYFSIEMIAVAAGEAEGPAARHHPRLPRDHAPPGPLLPPHAGADARHRSLERHRHRRNAIALRHGDGAHATSAAPPVSSTSSSSSPRFPP